MRSKGKLITQWFASVLVILLVVSAIAIPLRKINNAGGGSSPKDETTEQSGVSFDKEIIIF